MKISKKQQEFIDVHFNESDSPKREKFEQLTTSEELHYLVSNHNWDSGIEVLQWIAESELCSEATALMIFWRAQPEEYTGFHWDAKKLPRYTEIFDLIRIIIENFKNDFYKKTDISYDPKDDMPQTDIIPLFMLQATNGEETYIYYDESEVASWFGEYLDNQLYRCNSAIDLFNIVFLLKSGKTIMEVCRKIIDHPFCDKGIALLCFWRLKNYANLYGIEEISKEIIGRIENNYYQEVLKYDPQEDKDVKIPQIQQWVIPSEMRKPINNKEGASC